MFHAIATLAERDLHQDPTVLHNLNAILAVDVKNAFNTVSRKHLLSLLQKGCSNVLGPSSAQPRITSNNPTGWDVLWPHVLAHYGGKGLLKYYHDGEVTEISSESGVHQGCPLGSTLFAFALHPLLRFSPVLRGLGQRVLEAPREDASHAAQPVHSEEQWRAHAADQQPWCECGLAACA